MFQHDAAGEVDLDDAAHGLLIGSALDGDEFDDGTLAIRSPDFVLASGDWSNAEYLHQPIGAKWKWQIGDL